ncbi:hypothetical protein [Pseudomonas veronii]|nr:hypothetical protein [Pseudomonas veronii]
MLMIEMLKKYLFKLAGWSYLFFAGAASVVVALKGFAYAHFLSATQYAQINYYLLILGVGVLVVGSGVIIKCHSEMPLIVDDEDQLVDFVSSVKVVGVGFWMAGLVAGGVYGVASGAPLVIFLLSFIQVLVFFVFTVDLMVVKSRKQFVEYAKRLFYRNLLIATAGLCAAFFSSDATFAVASEVFVGLLLCIRSFVIWLKGLVFPRRAFVVDCLKFVPVTCVGAIMQYMDRIFAAYFMNVEEFSKFSYLSLVVMVGLSVQQLINARVITLLPAVCRVSPRDGFRYVFKISIFVSLLLLCSLVPLLWLLQSRWIAAKWFEAGPGLSAAFLMCTLLRAADFYSTYLLVMAKKNILLIIQLTMFVFFSAFSAVYGLFFSAGGVLIYMVFMCFGFFVLLMLLFFVSWRVSFVKKSS